MIADVLIRASVVEIRRKSCLPLAGQVLVQEGQDVHTGDILAEAEIHDEILTVDIARALGVRELLVDDCLSRQIGEHLEEGDIVAQTEGAFPRLVRAPVSGLFLDCYNGKAVLAVEKVKITQKAQMIGCVESVIPEFGVNLLATGTLVQGVWGNGLVGEGLLKVINPFLEEEAGDRIDLFEPGQILVINGCLNLDLLNSFLEKQISGLICSTLISELIPRVSSLPIPVIVLDGFREDRSDDTFLEHLRERNGALACMNASKGDAFSGQRPELVIPVTIGEPEVSLNYQEKLIPGQTVQITSGDYQGKIGELVSLSSLGQSVEAGQQYSQADVASEGGEVVRTSCWNLIILSD